jgi:hypothetical protein
MFKCNFQAHFIDKTIKKNWLTTIEIPDNQHNSTYIWVSTLLLKINSLCVLMLFFKIIEIFKSFTWNRWTLFCCALLKSHLNVR